MRLNPGILISKTIGLLLRLMLFGVILATPGYLFLSNFAVFEPFLFPLHYLQGNVRHVSKHIIVGPYPDYGLLANLHKRGVKIIISLLDPRLIYENSLIHREDLLAQQLGIKEYNFPMNSGQPPSSPLNAAALHDIEKIIAINPRTTVYIHCYLGKHRVGDVVTMLDSEPGHAALGALASTHHS
jgi:hypothetical protein